MQHVSETADNDHREGVLQSSTAMMKNRINNFAVLLVLAVYLSPQLFGLVCLGSGISGNGTPEVIRNLVLKQVDENYLYASDPQWQKEREQISGNSPTGTRDEYQVVRAALAAVHDPELHLVSGTQLAALKNETEGQRIGVGLMEFSIDEDPGTGEARIVTPLLGSPAAEMGLGPGDIIVSINGTPTRGADHEQVIDQLRTTGKLELQIRRGQGQRSVRLTASETPLRAIDTRLIPTKKGFIAYIQIAQFTSVVDTRVRAAIEEFEAKRPRGYIIDLRNNPGGLLNTAAHVCGLFVSGKLGNKIRRNGQSEEIFVDSHPETTAPLVILVNEGTASAAEFVAGALQGRRRATLIGATTYGRGQAQLYKPLTDDYGLVIPSALLSTPEGVSFKGKGLMPDIIVSSPQKIVLNPDFRKDAQLRRAIRFLENG